MAIKQYTPEQFLEEYKQIPKEEQQLFLDAVAYWEKLNLGKKVTVPVDKQSENGGASYTGTPPILSMVIKTGLGGKLFGSLRKAFLILLILTYYVYAKDINSSKTSNTPFVLKKMKDESIDSLIEKIKNKAFMQINKNKDWGKGKLQVYFKKPIKGNNPHYIKNILGKIGDKIVLDVHYSKNFHMYLGGSYALKEYLYFKNELMSDVYIDYFITDNYNNRLQKSFKIKKSKKVLKNTNPNSKNDFLVNINPRVWKKTKIEDIITLLYGQDTLDKFNQQKYKNIIRKFNTNSWKNSKKNNIYHFIYSPILFKFETPKDINSIALLYTAYENPLLAVYNFHQTSIPYVRNEFYLPRSGEIIIVGKGKNGDFYMSKPYFIDLDTIRSADQDDATGLYFTIK